MTCTVAAIIWILGSMPRRGTTISVPRSQIATYSEKQQRKAKACARKYGLKWKIEENK